jgi:hypothetical protein
MVKSGSKKRPIVVRVQTQTRAEEIVDLNQINRRMFLAWSGS